METKGTELTEAHGSPTRCLLDLIADKWTVLLMSRLSHGAKRFTHIRREVGVSQKVLTQTLRRLERSGLVLRTVFAEVPPRVEYSLTDLGRTLCEPLAILQRWADEHHLEVLTAMEAYDQHANKRASEDDVEDLGG